MSAILQTKVRDAPKRRLALVPPESSCIHPLFSLPCRTHPFSWSGGEQPFRKERAAPAAHTKMSSLATPQPMPAEFHSPADVSHWQQSMLTSLSNVIREQDLAKQALKVLEDRVVTKPELEKLINDTVMTKADFARQRAADEAQWQPLVKQRVTKRWLIGMIIGQGCLTIAAILLASVVTAGVVLLATHFLSL